MVKKLSAASTISHRFANQGSNPATPAAGFWTEWFRTNGFYIMNSAGIPLLVRPIQQQVFIPASQMYPSTTAGASAVTKTEAATNDQNIQTIDFDAITTEYAEFSLMMPNDWNEGTITFQAIWTCSAGTAGAVEWNVQARSYANSDAIDQAWGTAIEVSDTFLAQGDVHITDESAALTVGGGAVVRGEFVLFRVFRDAVTDTFDADAKLLGIRLLYK